MGGILSRIFEHDACPSGSGQTFPNDVFVDFENAQPLPDEVELYNEIQELIKTCDKLMRDLESYTGIPIKLQDSVQIVKLFFRCWRGHQKSFRRSHTSQRESRLESCRPQSPQSQRSLRFVQRLGLGRTQNFHQNLRPIPKHRNCC